VLTVRGEQRVVELRAAESQNWNFRRQFKLAPGPVWFPINYLLIESLQQFHHYYGDDFKVECPPVRQFMHLKENRERAFQSLD